jgi:hypothetical protein
VSGSTAGDLRACCLPLKGAVLNIPEASKNGSTTAEQSIHNITRIGSVTAPVRDACPACTTGLVITAQGGVCATFASAMSQRPKHCREDVACWQLCSSTASDSTVQATEGFHMKATWQLVRVHGVVPTPYPKKVALLEFF